jgi:twitching motility protein PilT
MTMDFSAILRFAVDHGASDIHIQAGLVPVLRLGGHIKPVKQPPVSDDAVREFITSIAPPRMRDNVDDRLAAGMDFSYAIPNV